MKACIIDFPKITDTRGNLTFIQHPLSCPFKIQRVFWTYDVPAGEFRGGHAYKMQSEVIIAVSGSFDVVITSSEGKIDVFQLNRPYFGLYLPPKIWRHMENFSTNAVSLHLSSSLYNEDDYVRDFGSLSLISQ
jgi:hypothetical protein